VKSQSLEEPNLLQELRNSPTSRRAFLKTMGAAGLGLAAITLLDGCGGGNDDNNGGGNTGSFPIQSLPGTGDQKILNYALTLELLEADLYRQALNLASGKALSTPLNRTGGPSSYTRAANVGGGGLDAARTAAGFAYLRDFAFVEDAHARFLQTALGGVAVSRNAKGYTFGSTVNADIKSILTAILPLEETGVRAYLGAGKYFQSLSLLQTAVSIYSTEARHSSAINYILDIDPGPYTISGDQFLYPVNGTSVSTNTFEHFLEPTTVVNAIQKFLVK